MLLRGPGGLESNEPRAGVVEFNSAGVEGASECRGDSSGEDGAESPSTVVLGRKRDAMIILWCRRELIVVLDEEREPPGVGDGRRKKDGEKQGLNDVLSRRSQWRSPRSVRR